MPPGKPRPFLPPGCPHFLWVPLPQRPLVGGGQSQGQGSLRRQNENPYQSTRHFQRVTEVEGLGLGHVLL